MIRSPYDDASKRYALRIHNLLNFVHGKVVSESTSPGWLPKENELADKYEVFFNKNSNEKTKQVLITGGVEPAYIMSKRPNMSAIAIGPNILDVHTPNERLDIASTQSFFKLLIDFLPEIK
jgi:dipeptidase D